MIAQVSPPAFASIGWKFYLVFAICGFTNAVFFWAFLPETRGIPLEGLVHHNLYAMLYSQITRRAGRLLQPRAPVRARLTRRA